MLHGQVIKYQYIQYSLQFNCFQTEEFKCGQSKENEKHRHELLKVNNEIRHILPSSVWYRGRNISPHFLQIYVPFLPPCSDLNLNLALANFPTLVNYWYFLHNLFPSWHCSTLK